MSKRKMSLRVLSDKVDIPTWDLSKFIKGEMEAILFTSLNSFCEALECQTGDLLEYKPDKRTSHSK